MKNKEIEELLNKFKIADSQQFNELVEDFNNVYKLLSYIEQLENNRDKAIEYIKIELSQGGERELRDLVDGYEVLDILKGDSDD